MVAGKVEDGVRFGWGNGQEKGEKDPGVKGGTDPLGNKKTAGLEVERHHFSNRPLQVFDNVIPR
jgi:hypothetical protein